MSTRSIMVAAGGTGGHLFPAFALAEELQRRGWDVDLMTDMRGDRYGTGFPARQVYQVPAATLQGRSPIAAARTALTLARGVAAARGILARTRPAVVAGFGGYPTLPPLVAGALARIPTALHEQNAVMGRANRLLARVVTGIALSFEGTQRIPEGARAKTRVTGNPIRAAVIAAAKTPYAAPVADGPFRLLVFGGSQGARFFSEAVPEAVGKLPEALKRRLQVVQQCREEDLAEVRSAYEGMGIKAELAPFFTDLPRRIADAHLTVARSGASTVAELAVLGRPAILVPFPHALDKDQLENATRLEEAGGAWCLPQRDLTAERLSGEIGRLAREPGLLSEAAANVRSCGKPDAVARLADLIEELAAR